jgi:NADH:ubiquinone oxidoreductase subunit 4 (subunit M)
MSLLTLLILVPLLAALLVVLIPGHYRFVIRLVAIAATLATLLLALTIFL